MKRIFQIFGLLFIAIAVFVPDLFSMDADLILGSTLITTSVSWGGKENLEYFLKPMFIGKSPWETQGVRVLDNVQSGQKLNYFSAVTKILKAYTKGFNDAGASTYSQRTINTYRLKAESSDDANDFYQTVFEQALSKDDWNKVDAAGKTAILRNILAEIYGRAVKSDVFRIFWLADPNKETLDTNGVFSGTADTNYNMITDGGMWYKLMAAASTTPTATQIYRKQISNAAVAQVATVTMSAVPSGGGDLILTVMGVDYEETYDTDYTTTAAAFVTSHAAALALRGITVTSGSGDTITFTSAIPGQPFGAPTFSSSSDVTGTVAATTANTAPSDLASGEAEDIFLDLYTNCDIVLKQVPKDQKVFLVDRATFENYQLYLEAQSTERSHLLLENGIEMLKYRGIAVICMDWDEHLSTDFPHASTNNPAYQNRVIYTALGNLIMGMDSMAQYNNTKFWYNEDEEENRFRTKLIMGTNYVHNKLVAVAY